MARFSGLAVLEPLRRHYQWYYSSRPANADMLHCEQGLHAYYHYRAPTGRATGRTACRPGPADRNDLRVIDQVDERLASEAALMIRSVLDRGGVARELRPR